MESQHHSRQSCSRHRSPEQRALHRTTRLESPAIRQGSGHGEACLSSKPAIRVGDYVRSRAADCGQRAVGPSEGAAGQDAPGGLERRSEAVQPGATSEVSLLRPDEVRGVRRRVRDVLARPAGVLRRPVAWHVHESPDDQPPGGGGAGPGGAARQVDAPRPVRGFLPRVRARAESAANGAPR